MARHNARRDQNGVTPRALALCKVDLTSRGHTELDCLAMKLCRLAAILALSVALSAFADTPKLPGVGAAMQEMIARNEIAGAVTVVVSKDRFLHLETTGFADVAAKRPMTPDSLFWIASMTHRRISTQARQHSRRMAIADAKCLSVRWLRGAA